jgi:hypothetical protein
MLLRTIANGMYKPTNHWGGEPKHVGIIWVIHIGIVIEIIYIYVLITYISIVYGDHMGIYGYGGL